MRLRLLICEIFTAALLLAALSAHALTVTWDANPSEEQVNGYTVLWGPTSNGGLKYPDFTYPNAHELRFELGQDITEYVFPSDVLTVGQTYYFAVVAVRRVPLSDGTERIDTSSFSNEVAWTVFPALTAPTIRIETRAPVTIIVE